MKVPYWIRRITLLSGAERFQLIHNEKGEATIFRTFLSESIAEDHAALLNWARNNRKRAEEMAIIPMERTI